MNSILKEDMEYLTRKFGDISKFNNKTVLITGFAGFLGYYFTYFFDHIAKNGVNVKAILCDNFLLGKPEWLKDFQDSPRFKVESLDVISRDFSEYDYLKEANYVIHMASVASPVFYRQYPLETIEANVIGLRKLLEFYKDKDLDGFLFFSSSEIYGDPEPDKVPTDEEYRGNVSCIGPRSCYDEAKRFGETLSYYYADIYKMPIGVARPFNNYGPGMKINDKRVPADFAKFVLNNEDIVIFSDGTPKRTFCYVADAICGYLKILTYGKYDYFNIGKAAPEISIAELAELYGKLGRILTGYAGSVRLQTSSDKNYLANNPNRRAPVIKKAERLLGYYPEIELEEGVEKFLRYLIEEKIK
jgi:UDP-glucuronate decarboxylase